MARYRFRYFFDYGGSCLWSGDPGTSEEFGYAIDPSKLPLSKELVLRIEKTAKWFDQSLNWEYPPDPGQWRQNECDRFNTAAQELFQELQGTLGPDFELVNEQRLLAEDPDLDEYLNNPKALKRGG